MFQRSFYREPEVRALTKLSKSTRWRLEKKGNFPKRRQLSTHAVGWLATEIEAWIASREHAETEGK